MSKSDYSTRSSLIARIRTKGGAGGWEEFVAIYEPLIGRYARSRGLPAADADDVVQEVLAKLLQELPKFDYDRAQGQFRSWLWRLTINAITDQARRRARDDRAKAQWCEKFILDQEQKERELEREWQRQFRQNVLNEVLPKVRSASQSNAWKCFEECVLNARKAGVVAEQLGLKVGTVYVYTSQVLNRVREQCADYCEELQDE